MLIQRCFLLMLIRLKGSSPAGLNVIEICSAGLTMSLLFGRMRCWSIPGEIKTGGDTIRLTIPSVDPREDLEGPGKIESCASIFLA